MTATSSQQIEIKTERKKLKRELTLLPLFGLIYFTVCGGAFGAEPIIGWSGPGMAMLLLILTPIVFSIPIMLMVRELQSMMPVEGGYYHWIKQGLGGFAGFMSGWLMWVVSWLDVSIYPVWATYYLGFLFPALSEGTTIGGVYLSASLLQFLTAALLIWSISLLQIRGSRLSGLTSTWIGLVMITPLIIMSIIGIYSWIKSGTTVALPFTPPDTTIIAALSTGLFVAMWNYMGWELPTAAGDEIVNPKKTYPRAMALVLVAAILTYALPTLAGLYGGAGDNGRYQMWGIEEYADGEGIGPVLADYGITDAQIAEWGVNPEASSGWEFPDIAQVIGEKVAGKGSMLASGLGLIVMIAAVLSMIGLFIGNSLGGSRVPFALAEDGMFPKWLVKVHPKYGTPWIAIIFVGVIFTIFATNAFAFLVVADVFLQSVVIVMEFIALWRLRKLNPNMPRSRIPGGTFGLVLCTLAPFLVIGLAVYSQFSEEGLSSLGWALGLAAIGLILYFPFLKRYKPGVPDVNPYEAPPEEL
jgi:amino acid transporter